MRFRIKNIFKRKKKYDWLKRFGTFVFYLQFFIAIYFFLHELRQSCLVLEQALCLTNQDLIVYHYLKLIFLAPIIGFSLLLSILEIISGWDFEFEQEIVMVFVVVSWLVLGLMSLYLPG